MLSIEEISACGIIPVVVLNDADAAVPTARALLRGGIDVMEITFRTAAAQASIARVTAEVPEMKVGAGTVVTVQQARDAVAAGAKFLVSPGSDANIIREAAALNTPIVPGVVTPQRDHARFEAGREGVQILPGGELWRAEDDQGAQRPVSAD